MKTIANRKEPCNFDIYFREEKWNIESKWIQENGEIAWYDGVVYRDGVKFMRIFSPNEILEKS